MACSNSARATLTSIELGAHGLELRLGLGDVDVRGDPAFEPALGQVELVFEVVNGALGGGDSGSRARGARSSRRRARRGD